MPEFILNRRKEIQYTNDQLKGLVKQAFDAEVADREKTLERPLSEEEKKEIKITQAFLDRYHASGLLPNTRIFQRRFGSIIHLANLLGLSSGEARPRNSYFESEKGEYLKALRNFVGEFKSKHERLPTRPEIRQAIFSHEIPDIPTTIFKYFDVFAELRIPE